jgi:cytochrome c-type biogenesis protein CcmH
VKKIFIIFIFLLSTNSYSEDIEKQYKSLIEELRCMVCQNQNLAESEAPLAVDMKQKIKEMLESGKNKEQIKKFLSERYSSYILYEPPINNQNIILWFGPLIFIIILSYILFRRYIK